MGDPAKPLVLILTAAFGEGHNSAAKALAAALEERARPVVFDPCALGLPRTNALAKWGYKLCITRLPFIWKLLFLISDRSDMSRDSLWWVAGARKALEFQIEGSSPDVIVSTYPLYPYFLDKYFQKTGKRTPYYIVVTDSLVINKSWLCVDPDAWMVTDGETKQRMVLKGVPADKILVTGFPISSKIAEYPPLTVDDWTPGGFVKVLYFGNRSPSDTLGDLTAILDALPQISVTVVLGRNVRKLYRVAEKVKRAYPNRLKVIGWTRRVPELLAGHHLIVGKAGGATVHEALAAQCPMLINHVVYGQEQGNAELLERLGGGRLTLGPETIRGALQEIFGGDSPGWFEMKNRLKEADMRGGTPAIVDLVLQKAAKNST